MHEDLMKCELAVALVKKLVVFSSLLRVNSIGVARRNTEGGTAFLVDCLRINSSICATPPREHRLLYCSTSTLGLGLGLGLGLEVAPGLGWAALLSETGDNECFRVFEAASFVLAASALSFLPAFR